MKKIISLMFIAVLLCGIIVIPARAETTRNRIPTQEEAVEWVLAQVGKKIDYNGDGNNMCADLAHAYSDFVYGYDDDIVAVVVKLVTRDDGSSYYIPSAGYPSTRWDVIYDGNPQPGDVVTWAAGSYTTESTETGRYTPGGHVAIVVDVHGNTFSAVDQNNTLPIAKMDDYSVSRVAYFIRPHYFIPGPNDTGDLPVLSVSNSENNFTLSWNKSTWAKYRLSVSVGNTDNWQTLRDYTADDEMKCDGAVTDNNIYYYKVETIDTTDTVCKTSNIVCVHKSTNGSVHDLTFVEGIEATDEHAGLTAHYVCSVCGNRFYDADAQKWEDYEALIIPVQPHVHKPEYVPAVKYTDTTIGEDAHWHCKCGKDYLDGEAETLINRSLHIRYPEPAKIHFAKSKVFSDQFADVSKDKWYYQNVIEAFELALMKGNSDTVFNPEGNVSVVEAITMACRIHSIHATGTENFTQGNPWYQVYLDYALENGIISEEMYSSDVTRIATRAEFAEIFAKALPDIGLIEVNNVYDGDIPDVAAGASYYDAVYKLYRAGILNGSDDKKTFYPNNNISRAECAAIVSRMADVNNRIISKTFIYSNK